MMRSPISPVLRRRPEPLACLNSLWSLCLPLWSLTTILGIGDCRAHLITSVLENAVRETACSWNDVDRASLKHASRNLSGSQVATNWREGVAVARQRLWGVG